jgi:hypothetical protein
LANRGLLRAGGESYDLAFRALSSNDLTGRYEFFFLRSEVAKHSLVNLNNYANLLTEEEEQSDQWIHQRPVSSLVDCLDITRNYHLEAIDSIDSARQLAFRFATTESSSQSA